MMSQLNKSQMEKTVGMLPGESVDAYLKRSANIRNATPIAPSEKSVADVREIKAVVRTLDKQREARIEKEREARDAAADVARENPYRAMLDSDNLTLSRKQRKHLEAKSAELIESRQAAEAEAKRRQEITTSDAWVRALGHSTALVDNVPEEFKAEAEQLSSDLTTSLDISAYYAESQALIAKARAKLDAAFAEKASAAMAASEAATQTHNALSAVENLNTTAGPE